MEADILEQLFDEKITRILRLFFKQSDQQFYIREIARRTKIPVTTTFRIVNKLTKLNLIELIKIKRFKVYQLSDNERTRFLGQVIKKEKQALEVFITKAKDLANVESIILQGKEESNRANIIIIGKDIDQDKVKNICAELRDGFNFTITPLILQRQQFEQMEQMGLYPEGKKLLYEKNDQDSP